MQEIRRILIVRTDRIGDVLLTLPMAHILKRQFPNAHIGMLIRHYTAELVEDEGTVDQLLFYDGGTRLLPFFHLVSVLRAQQFDVVFHTYPRFRLALVTWFSGIPLRVGTGYRWYSFLFNKKIYEHRKNALRHELEYNLNLLSAIGCAVGDNSVAPSLVPHKETIDKVKQLLAERGIRHNERFVVVHPGSGGSARDWSTENFGSLAHRISQIPDVKVVITGGSNEGALVERVRASAGDSAVTFIDVLTLKEYAALAKLSSLFIGNSSGPIHIAAAVGAPVIGLYPQITALNAARWGPYTQKKKIFSPRNKPVDCKECLGRDNGYCECMETIAVDEVFESAVTFLTTT